jgi:hypothetical protein
MRCDVMCGQTGRREQSVILLDHKKVRCYCNVCCALLKCLLDERDTGGCGAEYGPEMSVSYFQVVCRWKSLCVWDGLEVGEVPCREEYECLILVMFARLCLQSLR